MKRHAQLIKLGLHSHPIFATRLINDYTASQVPNSLSHAHQLFDQIPHKDTVLWTSLISAYTRSHYPHIALQLFSLMLRHPDPANRPNHFIFASVARAIASAPEHLLLGQTVHARVTKSGFVPNNVVLETAFVDMYSKCGVMECSRMVFDEMSDRNLVTWNAMVSGYVHNCMEICGLELFFEMKCREFYVPDEFSVATVLTGCAWVHDLVLGMQVHGYAIVSGIELDCVSSICNMYFYCGQVSCAERVLSGIECDDVVSKLMKIRGYVFNQRYSDALRYVSLGSNIVEILNKDYTVIVPILSACANLSLLRVGMQVHNIFITTGNAHCNFNSSEDDAIIGSALIDLYSKCRCVGEALKVFEDWRHATGVSPWNSMMSGYIYNGCIEDASTLMENMPEKNVVSWTTLMSGYLQIGMPEEGLNLLTRMYATGEKNKADGNCQTFVVGLEACRHLIDFGRGRQIHTKVIRTLMYADISNVIVGTALVDMYSKSGYMKYAQTVFDLMLHKNVVAWTSIITGYAVNGFGFRALEIFKQMILTGLKPNDVTFVSVFTASSHCGLVDEGLQYFKLMRDKYSLVPREDHYTCLIDMLGRVGRLEEAWSLLEDIKDKNVTGGCSSGTVWAALLGACHLYDNVELGSLVAKKLLENGKQVSTTYVTLSNVYAASEMWNEVHNVRESLRNEGNVDQEPGLSRICANPGDC